jgi:hypothetical protein
MFNSLLNGWSYLTYDPEDEHGTWTHDQFIEMDERFVAALEAAFSSGSECRNSASAEFRGVRKGSAGLARQRARQMVEAAVAG